MAWNDRKKCFAKVEKLRPGRTLVALFNFDRASDDANLGVNIIFNADMKEALFRVLKETPKGKGIDLCLYTRGGDTNGVWPIVSLLREFDPEFEVLVPFRCHSAGTLLALGAKRVVLTELSELSPIDPTTGNQFNPQDPAGKWLGISVEDVQAFRDFAQDQVGGGNGVKSAQGVEAFMMKLVDRVHPLALGNVHRVHKQIQRLAKELLALHPVKGRDSADAVKALTSEFQSHLHMISRQQAKETLGEQIAFASRPLAAALDELLRAYEDDFNLRRPFIVKSHLGDATIQEATFVGGAVESRMWSYLFKTRGRLHQFSALPPNVQVQIPLGQGMPLVPGLPREHRFEMLSQTWEHNTEPQGVTKLWRRPKTDPLPGLRVIHAERAVAAGY